MRAIRVTDFETAPKLLEVAQPVPAKGEALVRIAACGLNFADLLMCKGTYQDTPATPFTLGMEIAGVVEALGPDTDGPKPGTRVAIFAGQGGMAEYGVFPANELITLPDAMPFEEAAGFMIAYGTSHLALTRRAKLRAGERLVVLGAAGGVGLTAIEIGVGLGAEVVAVARGAAKLEVAKAAGATHLIDSDGADLRAELKALGGVDVVYDAVGGAHFMDALRATRPEGRILTIGFASGDIPQIPANHILVKNIDVIGFYWGGYPKFAPEIVQNSLSELMQMYVRGEIHPHIGAAFPLEQAQDALDFLRERKSTGKVVVTTG